MRSSRWRVFVVIAMLMACKKSAVTDESVCIGAPNAKHAFVYMHGLDSTTPGGQELENRAVLKRLAKELDARFAIARSDQSCIGQDGPVCWGWAFKDDELVRIATVVDAAALTCFDKDRRYGLVGFSNGGYALDQMITRCKMTKLLPHATRAVTVGAALLHGPIDAEPELSACGELVMIEGTKDKWNFDPDDNYLHQLQKHGAHARSVHVDGMAHELSFEPLRDALRE